MQVELYGVKPTLREFYNGRPLWKIGQVLYQEPWSHRRTLALSRGAFYWADASGSNPAKYADGSLVWDTETFWTIEQQAEQHVPADEDLYGPD